MSGRRVRPLRLRSDIIPELPPKYGIRLDPLRGGELDLMIDMGWGDTPQNKLPKDWKTRRNLRGKAGW